MIRELLARVRSFFRKGSMDADLDAELSAHLEMSMADHIAQGLSPEEARRRALIDVGGIEQARELHRDSRGLPALDSILQDIRYSFRTLRRDAGLTTFAILIVGLGVGASSTVFSVVNTLLLRPLPFHDPDRLVWINNNDGPGRSGETIQGAHLQDLQTQSQSFSDAGGFYAHYSAGDSKLTGSGEPERFTGIFVTETFFRVLGVQAQLGRLFSPLECTIKGPRVVLLSHQLWERRFASDPAIVGKSLTINDTPITVVGVLPASFDFAAVFAPGSRIDLFRPFPIAPETSRMGNTLALVGRLKPGATPGAAQAEVKTIVARVGRDQKRNTFVPTIRYLKDHVSGNFRASMFALACAVGLVMLIVCANLSNLLLARTTTREKEIAIRASLGADHARLIRQMLTESIVLSCGGAALGLLLAIGGTRALASLPARIPLLQQIRVDAVALTFTLLIAVLTGIVFGLAPAMRVSTLALHNSLKESGRGSSHGKRHSWIRGALVVCEVTFACVLLVGSGLLIRSFLRVLDVDMGFKPQNAFALRIDPGSKFPNQTGKNAFFDEMLSRVSAAPGIQAAGLIDALPMGTDRTWGIAFAGARKFTEEQHPEAFVHIVSNGYLQAMGIPLRSGRDLSPGDIPTTKPVILINETLARVLFPEGENPVGRSMQTDFIQREIVGVVQDVHHVALEQEAGAEMYIPIRQTRDYSSVELVVRGTNPGVSLASTIRATLQPIDSTLPVKEFRTIQDIVDKSVSPRRLIMLLLGGFAAFALILASLGIYAVISYSVNQRKQEIGIRMALGASSAGLQKSILIGTLKLAAIGIALGSAASWVAARALQSLLFGVTPEDPLTFAAMLLILTSVAALAGYLPARRASRLNPVDALRAE